MNSSFLAYVDTISQYSPSHINASIHLKSVFVSRLGVIYCYSWIFRVLARLGTNFICM